MRHILSTLILACVLGLILPGQAQARTWTVEKDGSGDFTVIQDALDAASPGDSVVVGPGRYDDFTPRAVEGGFIESIARIDKSDITLIGEDREGVILGPLVMPPNTEDPLLVGIFVESGTGILIENMTLEHTNGGVNTFGEITLRNVSSSDNDERGLTSNGPYPLTVQDCSFEKNGRFGLILGTDDYNILVERCRFVDNQEGIQARSTQGITIRDCHFEAPNVGGSAGVNIVWGAFGEVSDCTFGIFPQGGGVGATNAHLSLTSNTFAADSSSQSNIWVRDAGHVEATDNEFGGAENASVFMSDRATGNFHENHILKLGQYALVVTFYSLPGTYPQHFENNWWGTDDESQVAQWIYDAPDPDGVFTPIYWQPILGQPVPTEETSFGKLKSRFRSP